ncbi:ABC transporter substrate-binding protein [Halalkalicoccus subterraneus]|uniref:ABC transporter substrate-binding protein n=1 Tax=Halalkalicoccus subterraneus TaxID=2675002 RepID=UPI000EFB3A31|nr:ABC transporter substrate-binding protein [Halalkalicoccus subterraneus]
MRTREFRALDGNDEAVISRLALGLGEEPARVLTFLHLRTEFTEEPATELTLRIGTGLSRGALTTAVGHLESADLVDRTTVRGEGPGRPPTAWDVSTDLDAAVRTVYRQRARGLLERAREGWGVARSSRAADESNDGLVLGLNWRPNGLHLPFYAARRDERYGESGSDVRFEHYEGSRRALEAVRAREADVGLVGAATVSRARAGGAPVVPIAVAYQRAMAVLYTVRETFGEPLTGVGQLRERRIGMPARSETRILGRLFVNQVTLDGSVRIVDTAGEEQDALLAGEVDVVTGSFSDPRQLEQRGMTVDTLAVADHFPIYGPTLVVHEGTLADRGDALEAFLTGTIAGWAAAPESSAAAAGIAERAGCSPDRIVRTFTEANSEFGGSEAVAEHGWGRQDAETWERLRTALEQGGLLAEGDVA